MEPQIIERLLALNRNFYAAFAAAFSESRRAQDTALLPVLPYIPQGAAVLDVGCGNGRLALLLERERPGARYVGVDVVPELLEQARRRSASLQRVEASFLQADLARPGWIDVLPPLQFDCVALLAVLHHLPAFSLRARLLAELAAVLAPAGRLVLSTWQFLDHERMRRKIVPWSEAGLAEEQLEPGDYLLDWKRGGRGLRYCHLVDRDEVARLAAAGGWRVLETFRAGGREGDLSLFAVLELRQPG
ncbi:MAG: class I SAM-dependent methyltransferase [Chloroflexia bacterium]|nr:class I SAM-dependent methyltransferase [Chloroflexia bacterium]